MTQTGLRHDRPSARVDGVDAQLVFVEERPVTGRVLPIHTRMAIGREGCDVDLPDPEVSRHHATLEVHHGVAVLADAGSKNGTWVNDVRVVVPTELVAGDVVKFGNTVWHVRTSGAG